MEAFSKFFSAFATKVSNITGKPVTFVLAVVLVIVWAASGPFFGFSDVWQLVINTSTTIITFLMIFVLQNSQNRDSEAIQAKLDELILTSAAQDKFIGVEKLDDKQLAALKESLEDQADSIEEKQAERRTDARAKRKAAPRRKNAASGKTSTAKRTRSGTGARANA